MKKLFLGLIALSTLFALNSCDKENDSNYTVTFDSQGGTSVEKITVAEGSLISKPTDPTKQESTFGGWYKEAACTTAWNFSSYKVAYSITLYAKWNPSMDRQELIDSLEDLVEEANALVEYDYQLNGWVNMQGKLQIAKDVLNDIDNVADSEILAAHTALKLAIDNLIRHEPTDETIAWIDIYPREIDNKIYIVPGKYFELNPRFMSNKGNMLDYIAVFEYPGLADWAEEGRVEATRHSLRFEALDLNSGLQKQITVSAHGTSFSRPYVLETISFTELVELFKATVDGLDPENTDYDDLEEIRKASNLYWDYSLIFESETLEYRRIFEDCMNAFWALPNRIRYTVDGTSAQWVMIDQYDYTTDLEYEAQGTFPLGNWTENLWEYDIDYNAYVQYREVFKSGGVFAGETRTSINRDGSNPTAWNEVMTGTYEVDPNGNSTQGIFYMAESNNSTKSKGAKKFSRR